MDTRTIFAFVVIPIIYVVIAIMWLKQSFKKDVSKQRRRRSAIAYYVAFIIVNISNILFFFYKDSQEVEELFHLDVVFGVARIIIYSLVPLTFVIFPVLLLYLIGVEILARSNTDEEMSQRPDHDNEEEIKLDMLTIFIYVISLLTRKKFIEDSLFDKVEQQLGI